MNKIENLLKTPLSPELLENITFLEVKKTNDEEKISDDVIKLFLNDIYLYGNDDKREVNIEMTIKGLYDFLEEITWSYMYRNTDFLDSLYLIYTSKVKENTPYKKNHEKLYIVLGKDKGKFNDFCNIINVAKLKIGKFLDNNRKGENYE